MSSPGHGPPAALQAARNKRLERFRVTAPPRRLPAINATRPSRPRPSGVFATRAMRSGLDTRTDERKIRSISRADLIVLTQHASTKERGGRSGGQDLAALAAASGQDGATAACRHASTEAVRLSTLPDIGLIRSLHSSSLAAPLIQGKARRLYARPKTPSTPRVDRVDRLLAPAAGGPHHTVFSRDASGRGGCPSLAASISQICGQCGKGRTQACGSCG